MKIGYEAKRVFHNSSGLGNYSRNLIRAMAENYSANDYYLYNPSAGKIPFGKEYENIHEIQSGYSNPLMANLWRQALIPKKAFNDKIDVFHGLSHELPVGLHKKEIPSVVTIHDLIFIHKPELYNPVDRKIYTLKVNAACEQATQIVAASIQTKKHLIKYLEVPDEKIQVVYQSCDPVFWANHSEEEINKTIEKHKLPNEFVLFVGTLEERKNVDKLVEACQKLKLPLVLIGRQTDFWKKVNSKIKLPELIFTPKVPDNVELAHIYKAAKIFVYPSYFEGFGIPVLEAQACGTPVITSDKSSLPEVAGPDSILVDPMSESEILNAIRMVWESDGLRKKMTENSLKFASENFKDDVLSSQWQKIYSSIL